MSLKFYKCSVCGKIITIVSKPTDVPTKCCAREMMELIPNSSDGAFDKHVPVVDIVGHKAIVKVGSIEHPMQENHFIDWVAIETNKGVQRKSLSIDGKPEVEFALLEDEEIVDVYSYCNLHGLFKK